MSKDLDIDIDREGQTVAIEGVRYAYGFFQELGQHGLPVGQSFKLANRDEKTISIARIDEQAAITAFARGLTEGKSAPVKHLAVNPWCVNPKCHSACPACAIRKAANLDGKGC